MQTQSILGESAPRISTGGTIRPGIMVLTAKAKNDPKAEKIYMDGVASQLSFKAIGAQIASACAIEYPLRPMNVPFFLARRSDFHPPSLADKINDIYSTERPEIAEGKSRLYGFPIIFPFEDWLQNMPHSLREYSRSGVRHWSDYGADGRRYCNEHGEIPKDASGKALRRTFGGRIPVLRQDNGGLCLPNECQEYQDGLCKLSGRLIFLVPGIGAGSLFEMGSTSYYSMEQWRSKMLEVAAIRGRITGTYNGEPIFYLSKVQEEVSRIDPIKGPIKTSQWLVKISVIADLNELSRSPAIAHESAAAALEGPTDAVDDTEEIEGEFESADVPF